MNENNLDNNSNNNDTSTYRATSNLNTAIENPQINVNSATGVNMQDLGYNNYANNNNNNNLNNNSQFLNNSYNNQGEVNDYNDNITSPVNDSFNSNQSQSENDGSYTYEPVMQEKKVKKENVISSLLHSKEFKAIIFIVFILCLFLLVMPYIYDFLRNLKMSIFT